MEAHSNTSVVAKDVARFGIKQQFEMSEYDEPHFRRRREILKKHPEIRGLFGYDLRTAYVALAVATLQVLLSAFMEFGTERGLPLPVVVVVAFFVGAVLSHWGSMAIHECSHNLAAKSALVNRVIGIISSCSMVLPASETFRRYHLKHHSRLGVLHEDTDLPTQWEARHIGDSRAAKGLWLFSYLMVYLVRGATFAKRFNRAEILNVAIVILFALGVHSLIGNVALFYLALSTFFGHGPHPVAAHFIHEHYIFSGEQETYSYYGPLNHVTFNVGYHNEHHDFANVPGWDLPALKRMAVEYYAPLQSHRSWTAVLIQFFWSPWMTPWNRIVRTAEVQDRQRALLRERRAER